MTENKLRCCYYIVDCNLTINEKKLVLDQMKRGDWAELFELEGLIHMLCAKDIKEVKNIIIDNIERNTQPMQETTGRTLSPVDEIKELKTQVVDNYIDNFRRSLVLLGIDENCRLKNTSIVVDEEYKKKNLGNIIYLKGSRPSHPIEDAINRLYIDLDQDKKVENISLLRGVFELIGAGNLTEIKQQVDKKRLKRARELGKLI